LIVPAKINPIYNLATGLYFLLGKAWPSHQIQFNSTTSVVM
jgi:hypothetical protein